MEISQAITVDPRQYDHQRATWIAEQYADGDISLRELHFLHEDVVPSPYWLYRWRRDYPDFDLMMRDAERVRAQNLADDVISVAGDKSSTAAEARVKVMARQWLAERYDRDRYGNAAKVEHKHSGSVSVDLAQLSDDQLAAIAGGQQPAAIEGQATRIEDRHPAPPPQRARPPVAAEASDPPLPLSNFAPGIRTGNTLLHIEDYEP